MPHPTNLPASLLHGLDKTQEILNDLKEFNYGRWIVHYPQVNASSHSFASPQQQQQQPLANANANTNGSGSKDDSSVQLSSSSGSLGQPTTTPKRPQLEHASTTMSRSPSSSSFASQSVPSTPVRASPQRSQTAYIGSSSSPTPNGDASSAADRGSSTEESRGETSSSSSSKSKDWEQEEHESTRRWAEDLSILRLDLRVGPPGSQHDPAASAAAAALLAQQQQQQQAGAAPTAALTSATAEDASPASPTATSQGSGAGTGASLVHTLEKSSIAQLLDARMTHAIRTLSSLRVRLSQKQSKVLVTGDLNAGKSTLINSLLRRPELMPTDQQPCTTLFAEVLDADAANAGKEEVHLLREGRIYRIEDAESYVRYELKDLDRIVAMVEEEQEAHKAATAAAALPSTPTADGLSTNSSAAGAAAALMPPLLKCYCRDRRAASRSLLRSHAGGVDIALIDAPGLNRDSLKTTALFARQEEIDVILFVVSAENHFTLSAKEFLWTASNDKAYVFIVVNKFDQIRNKDKCKRLVLEQIRQLSPRTYEDADELVHFVDSSSVPLDLPLGDEANTSSTQEVAATAEQPSNEAFARLEASLRDFVLLKRSKSKLLPAQTYVLRLLSDIALLARTNVSVARQELAEAARELQLARPALAECKRRHEKLSNELESEEDATVANVALYSKKSFDKALQLVGNGRSAHRTVALPAYPGLFDVWQYAEDVRAALLQSIVAAVHEAEDEARHITAASVSKIKALGEAHLPAEALRSQRIFLPEAMFSSKRAKLAATLYGSASAAGPSGAAVGLGSANHFAWLGLGLDAAHARATDIVDVPHYLQAIFPAALKRHHSSTAVSSGKKALTAEEEVGLGASFTLGLGALTLLSGKALGAKTALETVLRAFDLIGNKTARQWAGPILAVGVAGAVAYVIVDLPYSIPRNIGRSIEQAGKQSARPLLAHQRKQSTPSAVANIANVALDESNVDIDAAFTAIHTHRVTREVRKVLRLADWDLQETFRQAILDRKNQVEKAEMQESGAKDAIAYFDDAQKQVKQVRHQVEQVKILDDVAPAATRA